MKHYLFLEESGDHGIENVDPQFPLLVLCGLLINEDSYKTIKTEIKSIKQDLWKGEKVIFNSRQIKKYENEFRILRDYTTNLIFKRRIKRLTIDSEYTVIAASLKKDTNKIPKIELAQNIYRDTFKFILQQTLSALDTVESRHEPLFIIFKKRGLLEDNGLRKYIKKLLKHGTPKIRPDMIKTRTIKIFFFDKSKNVAGLQLADLVTSPVAGYLLDKNRKNRLYKFLEFKLLKKFGTITGLKKFG